MSDTEGITLGISLSIGITVAIFLLAFLCYKIAVWYRERNEPEEPEDPTPAEEIIRPQQSQFSEITVRFFEEFGINGFERDSQAARQIEATRENRVRPADILPQYHEVADANLPSYNEAINVTSPSVCRVENERY